MPSDPIYTGEAPLPIPFQISLPYTPTIKPLMSPMKVMECRGGREMSREVACRPSRRGCELSVRPKGEVSGSRDRVS